MSAPLLVACLLACLAAGLAMSADTPGFTVRDLARRWRVSPDRVRRLITSGELVALNTRDTRCGRPRFVVTPEAVADFERRRQAAAAPTPPKPKRRMRTPLVDYFP